MATPGAATNPHTEVPTSTEKKGLSKMLSRMKTVLRRGDSSKRLSSTSMTAPVVASSSAPPADTARTESASKTAPAQPKHTPTDLERARHLAQKYDIELETRDWKIIEVAERVEKPIRMRIHRTCHICKATYGANKICSSCGHERCNECPRYPKKKDKGIKGKGVKYPEGSQGPGAEAIEGLKRKHKYVLTLPSKTGGQDLVLKRPMQRVRRTCHHCGSLFMPGNKICSKCSHVRCVDCPRDPPKRNKYPDGYPGDAPGSGDEADPTGPQNSSRTYTRPKRKVRYSCHNCKTKFKPTELTCQTCGHEKCPDCPRVPPRKVEPEPDPEVVKRVEEKLREFEMVERSAPSRTADPPPEGAPEVDPAAG